jgi:hypothetical protein
MLSDGMRLWPPARIFAPGRSTSSNAWASELALAYANDGAFSVLLLVDDYA